MQEARACAEQQHLAEVEASTAEALVQAGENEDCDETVWIDQPPVTFPNLEPERFTRIGD